MNPEDLDIESMVEDTLIFDRSVNALMALIEDAENPKADPVEAPGMKAERERRAEKLQRKHAQDRLQLAHDIINEMVGAAGLSIDQLELLGWDSYKFGYYGMPTAQENKDRAREIIRDAEDEIRERERDPAIETKARKIVGMLQGTMALEGQGLSDEVLEAMVQRTIDELTQQDSTED